ncbi:hypothetical protein LCGC14_1494870 [marine sediment metagenome]|uniref:Uncharacterized protein n=1 Tax=marine sediment metagenome TaxID=412755 RepID=A0A0F9J6A7_9ZZZZ
MGALIGIVCFAGLITSIVIYFLLTVFAPPLIFSSYFVVAMLVGMLTILWGLILLLATEHLLNTIMGEEH